MRTSAKLGLVGCLYMSEGLPFGFITQALPVLLRESGVSLSDIGLTSLLALPWALKFLWAPLVDRYWVRRLGRRRSWIIPVQLATAAVLFAAVALEPDTQLAWLFALVALCNLLAATLDIATDGLAVSLLRPPERGLGNGVQVAGYRVGMVIAGGFLLVVFERLGWSGSFLLLGSLILVLTLPVLLFREPPATPGPAGYGVAWRYLLRPGVASWLLIILTYKFCEAIGAGMTRPFLVDRGLTLAQIGWLLGTVGFGASLAGALVGGWLTSRLGYYRCVLSFGVGQAIAIAGFAVISTLSAGSAWPLYGVVAAEGLVSGMVTAAVFTMMMDACRPASEGSDYSLQACVFVVAMGLASVASGFLAEWLGYTRYFLLGAVMAMLALVPIALAARRGGLLALRLNRGVVTTAN
jgi:MFS family permease